MLVSSKKPYKLILFCIISFWAMSFLPYSLAQAESGEVVVSFPAIPSLPSWELELHNEWVPSFTCAIIWGYRVFVNGNFFGDFPAVYTPKQKVNYVLTDPQSITIKGLVAGQHYQVEIYPLGIYYSPNLVTNDGRRYAIKKTGPNVFLWAWVDAKGNPTSPWSAMQPLPDSSNLSYPGYFLIHKAVWSGKVQAKKSGGGGGGGHGKYIQ